MYKWDFISMSGGLGHPSTRGQTKDKSKFTWIAGRILGIGEGWELNRVYR